MTTRAALLVLALLAPCAGCTWVFFQPHAALVRSPADLGLAYEDVYLRTADEVLLHAWFLPARAVPQATILFLHGNAENISTHIGSVYWLPAHGFNVLLLDYRGYGRSGGNATLPGLQEDVETGVRYLIGRPDIDASRLIVFGQSLGGAVAAHYVAHSRHRGHIRAVVIDSAFASYRDIAREKLAGFWLTWPLSYPLALTVTDAYSPTRSIGAISPIPVLIVHGERDAIIPAAHGRRLYEAAQPPKDLWIVPDSGHIQAFRAQANRERFLRYLRTFLD